MRGQLSQDVRDVRLDGVAGHEKLGGDVRVRPAIGYQVSDLDLRRGQRAPSGELVSEALLYPAPADTEAIEPPGGALDVRARAQRFVQRKRLGEGSAGSPGVATASQQYRGVLKRQAPVEYRLSGLVI